MDLFLDTWNAALGRLRITPDEREIEMVLYAWLRAGSAVVLQQRLPVPLPTREAEWSLLSKDLEKIGTRAKSVNEPRAAAASEWLVCVALLLMPETVPKRVVRDFVPGPAVKNFWSAHAATIIHRRTSRLAELVRKGMRELVSELRPGGHGGKYDPTSAAIDEMAGLTSADERGPSPKRPRKK